MWTGVGQRRERSGKHRVDALSCAHEGATSCDSWDCSETLRRAHRERGSAGVLLFGGSGAEQWRSTVTSPADEQWRRGSRWKSVALGAFSR